ncbi:MAG: class I SAM-dependent RNA methyltransferase [Oscillospiraceae bacterium]|nr:class I SAM-dependent RNA methyltransferase [Oscillospiraceae bacterium]
MEIKEIMENDIITYNVTITGYNSDGDGVARLDDGKVVFVRGSARGDFLEVRLTEEKPRSARAQIVRIITPSPHRIEPDCSVYPECGGCDFRHITYEEELDLKLKRVNDALERIGGLSVRVKSVLNTGQVTGYRNKAVLHSDGTHAGFYRAGSHGIVPVNHCLLLRDDINNAIKSQKRSRAIIIRSGRSGLNEPIEEELDGLIFKVSGFFQVNIGAALLLFQKAREYANLNKNDTLVDLYCGVGAMTLFVGRDAGYAIGIEQNPDAIKTAHENASHNKLSHIDFINADAANPHMDIPEPTCIIVDPPRKGLSSAVINNVLELKAKRIIYVSCNPATMARDLKLLEGYMVSDICAVDMFPRTANIECCCLLEKT